MLTCKKGGIKRSQTSKTLSLQLKESNLDAKPNCIHLIGCVETARRTDEPESLHVFQLYHSATEDVSSPYKVYLTWREMFLKQTDVGSYNFSHFILDTVLPYFFSTGTTGSLVESNLNQFYKTVL